jgi:hypothetical protein
MRSITKQLPAKRWVSSDVLLFLLASLLPVVLIGPASPARGRVAASISKPAAPVTLRGEEAIAQLKQQGSDDSLAATLALTLAEEPAKQARR